MGKDSPIFILSVSSYFEIMRHKVLETLTVTELWLTDKFQTISNNFGFRKLDVVTSEH